MLLSLGPHSPCTLILVEDYCLKPPNSLPSCLDQISECEVQSSGVSCMTQMKALSPFVRKGSRYLRISLTAPGPTHQDDCLCVAQFECRFPKSYSGEVQDDERATFFSCNILPSYKTCFYCVLHGWQVTGILQRLLEELSYLTEYVNYCMAVGKLPTHQTVQCSLNENPRQNFPLSSHSLGNLSCLLLTYGRSPSMSL